MKILRRRNPPVLPNFKTVVKSALKVHVKGTSEVDEWTNPFIKNIREILLLAVAGGNNALIKEVSKFLPVKDTNNGMSRQIEVSPSLREWIIQMKGVSGKSVGAKTRIKKTSKGAALSVQVSEYEGFSSLKTRMGYSYYNKTDEETINFSKAMENMFGSDFFDLTKSVETTLKVSPLISDVPWSDASTLTTEANISIANSMVSSIRVISPSLPDKFYSYYKFMDKTYYKISDIPEELKLAFMEHAAKVRKMVIFANFNMPENVAQYITQSEKPDLSNVSRWLSNIFDAQLRGLAETSTLPINPLINIKRDNENETPRSKTNKEHLAISDSGQLLYIPLVDNLEQTDKDFQEYGMRGSEFALDDVNDLSNEGKEGVGKEVQFEKRTLATKNKIVLTDWINNKLSYTNTTGGMRILNLEGFIKADSTKIRRYLDIRVLNTQLGSNILNSISSILTDMELEFTDSDKADAMEQIESFYPPKSFESTLIKDRLSVGIIYKLFDYLSTFFNTVVKNSEDPASLPEYVETLGDWNQWTLEYISPTSPILINQIIYKKCKTALSRILADVPAFLSTKSILKGIADIGMLTAIVKYSPNYARIREADILSRKEYSDPSLDEDYVPKGVPFIKGLSLMPHQARLDNYLKNGAKHVILDVAAGGGKTILIMNYIMRMLAEGKVKRALVTCPGHLVKQYVSESIFLTNGQMNVIPITSSTFKARGEEDLFKMISTAPINTLVVSDFNFIKGKMKTLSYGNSSVEVGTNAAFLNQFGFDLLAIDESHYLRNTKTSRSKMMRKVASNVKYTLEATGTLIVNQMTDIAGQFSIVDPSIFGDREAFFEEYALEVKGNTVLQWKPDAERLIKQRLVENSSYLVGRRKEWAASLPDAVHKYHVVSMSDSQQDVYDSILKNQLEAIESNPKLKAKMLKGEEIGMDLLQPYLQRLEIFLSSPEKDSLGLELLEGEDLVSNKVLKISEICREHISSGIEGKVLIFASYRNTAASIYENLPSDLKAITIHYTAENKDADLAAFNRDPNKKILVGVEVSLNTGLNLQSGSRIIRSESVWTPGTLEQGEARVNRPDPKNKLRSRSKIYFDWVLTDSSIDITKTARLISKIINKTRFDQQDNRAYDGIEDLPVLNMSLKNLQEYNTIDSGETSLVDYLSTYSEIKNLEFKEFEEYRNNPNNNLESVLMEDGDIIPGSKIIENLPFVNDTEVAFSEEIGLVPLNDYSLEKENRSAEEFNPTGLYVHTEFGDGKVISSSKSTIRLLLDSGAKVSTKKIKAFVITKKSELSVFKQIAKLNGLPTTAPLRIETTPPIETDPDVGKRVPRSVEKKPMPNEDKGLNGMFNVYVSAINNSAALVIAEADPDLTPKELKSLGFVYLPKYTYAHIKTARHMRAVIDSLKENYDVRRKYRNALEEVFETFNQGKKGLLNVKQARSIEIRDFVRKVNRVAPKGLIRPYPYMQDGEMYIVIDLASTPSAITVKTTIRIPGVKWKVEKDGQWMYLSRTKSGIKSKIKEIIERGFIIENIAEVKKEYKEFKIRQ